MFPGGRGFPRPIAAIRNNHAYTWRPRKTNANVDVARYRLLGLLAGALAGAGSVLSAVVILERINSFSRIIFCMAALVGLLPGVAVYWALHVITDRLRGEPPEPS
jgi:hypothetical protein